MLFNSVEYVIFLATVVAAYFLMPQRWRVAFLLAASYFFYMALGWRYALLIAAQTLVSYGGARYLERESRRTRRLSCLILAVSACLGMLLYFKYSNFFLSSVGRTFAALGIRVTVPHLPILLPLGISFYSFRTLSYLFDVYRGVLHAEARLANYALYVAFFPELLAGPIERAGSLLAQFDRRNSFDLVRIAEGGKLIVWGLFKKAVIADRLAMYVDRVYDHPDLYSGSTLLLATYFFAFQIYCDFSGYSDIAIGSARMLGYDLMQNFRLPYGAASFSDFWQRWHISLSSWFRDYVYIPLGGNRVSTARWSLNIAVVFLLSGLWHGANWTFLVWGGLHAFCYLGEHASRRVTRGLSLLDAVPARVLKPLQVLVVFHLVLLGWVFFRADSLPQAAVIVARIFAWAGTTLYLGPSQFTTVLSVLLIGVLLLFQYGQASGILSLHFRRTRAPLPLRFVGYAALILAVELLAVPTNRFIYLQF
jgi:D-alanyl-lipoteichoic acid acyltransferase DltB (MBOAT superfamily)